MDTTKEIAEFIDSPSAISQHLVEIVVRLNEKYQNQFASTNFLQKIQTNFTADMYTKDGWKSFYLMLKDYQLPPMDSLSDKDKLKLLFKEFETLYDKLLLNNFVLAFLYTNKKVQDFQNPILTEEDRKIMLLQQLARGKCTVATFKTEFGQYSLNPFELSAERFAEYPDEKLLKIASFTANMTLKEKITIEEYIAKKTVEVTPLLLALRELAKYKSLLIIAELRNTLLHMAKEKHIEDVFGMKYKEVVK
jgi:hypothetical protein